VATFSPSPLVLVYSDPAGTVPVSSFGTPTLVINTTYYLKDVESVPPNVGYPGAQFYFGNGVPPAIPGTPPEVSVGSVPALSPGQLMPTAQPPFTPTATCPSGCYVRAAVQGVLSPPSAVVIASSAQPLAVSVNGPTTGSPGASLQFTASARGGSPSYNYAFDCSYAGFGLPNFGSPSPASSTTCTYPVAGNYYVMAQVTDSASTSAISSPFLVAIGGGTSGGLSATLSGPSSVVMNAPATFTANPSGGSGGYTYSWLAGESPFEIPTNTGSNPTFTHTYTAAATYTVACTVTSGGSTAQATMSVTVTRSAGPAAPTAAYVIQGATAVSSGSYDAEAGDTITFSAQEVPANVAPNGYVWNFGDGTPQYGQQVVFAFPSTGPKSVSLSVVGDGVNRTGTASAVIAFTIAQPSFQALMVPAAEHQPVPLTNDKSFFRTDVVVANPGTMPVTISPAYVDFSATTGINVFDLSTVTFDPAKKVTIPPDGAWSQADVVKFLSGDAPTKGTVVLKYDGGDATPLVTSRVYASPAADPLGPSAGSALAAVKATKDGQVITSGGSPLGLNLSGLRSDSSYYFRLSLVNSAGITGVFRVTAVDQDGNPVTMNDPRPGGLPDRHLDFIVNPYGGVDWSGDDLGLNDPSKRYVVNVRKAPGYTTGRPLAFAKLNDRATGDPSLVTADSPPEYREPCAGNQSCVNYVLPGVSRYRTPQGANWKTSISIYNPAEQTRGIGLTYSYEPTSLAPPERTETRFVMVCGTEQRVPGCVGPLAFWDDVVAQLFANSENHLADSNNGNAGILRIQHFTDVETTSAPLQISARNYDDQPRGTVGSELLDYTRAVSIGPADAPMLLTGLQQDDASNPKLRFSSTVNVFAYDDVQTDVLLTALSIDGSVLGTHHVVLNQPFVDDRGQPLVTGHFQPRALDASDATGSLNGVQNQPISIKVEVVQGGRIGVYGLIEDVTTHDPTYIQAFPQN
jgi:hypothetical protein